jgi:adenylate cyclase
VRYDEEAACYAKAMEANPRFSVYYFFQAAALALAGRVEEARPIVERLLELQPGARFAGVFEYSLLPRELVDNFMDAARLLGSPK